MKLLSFLIGMAATLLATSAIAQPDAVNRVTVTDLRTLFVAAIDSPDGEAHGILSGEMADMVSQHFKTSSPLYVDVTTERRLEQAGCSRLKVTIRQSGVVLPGAKQPKEQKFDMGINYCRNGLAPGPRT